MYRTFGGLRVILTGSGAKPDSDEAAELMAEGAIWRFRGEADERWTQRWVAAYATKSEGRATCRRGGSFGAQSSAIEQRIIDLHDQRSLADSGLPLA